MGNYALYIFDETIARQYYGQESKLYHLFFEYERSTKSKKELIQKQIEYITKPIPIQSLQRQLKEAFHNVKKYEYGNDTHKIRLPKQTGEGVLKLKQKCLHLYSTGMNPTEVETIFFEVLRKCDPMFFAVSIDQHKFGWLRPFKKVDYLPQRRVN